MKDNDFGSVDEWLDYDSNVQKLKDELKEQRKKTTEQEEIIKDLRAALTEAQEITKKSTQTLTEENSQLLGELEVLRKQNQELQKQLSNQSVKYSEIVKRAEADSNENNHLRNKLEQVNKEKRKLEEKVTTLETENVGLTIQLRSAAQPIPFGPSQPFMPIAFPPRHPLEFSPAPLQVPYIFPYLINIPVAEAVPITDTHNQPPSAKNEPITNANQSGQNNTWMRFPFHRNGGDNDNQEPKQTKRAKK